MEVTLDVSITLTGRDGARQSFVFVGKITFSCSIARKNISRLLGFWRPAKEAFILDLIRFKEANNSSINLFLRGMEMEVTLDMSIALTGGEWARQYVVFVGNMTFSCSIARKNISRLLGLWRPDTESLSLDLMRFKGDKNSSINLFFNGTNTHQTRTHHVPNTYLTRT